jgi:hypothetical protein
MKNIIVALIATFLTGSVYASGHVGDCVSPKTDIGKNGYLVMKKPIVLRSSPKSSDGVVLKELSTFKVVAKDGDYVQLMDVETQKLVGWASFGDFKQQDPRNCSL